MSSGFCRSPSSHRLLGSRSYSPCSLQALVAWQTLSPSAGTTWQTLWLRRAPRRVWSCGSAANPLTRVTALFTQAGVALIILGVTLVSVFGPASSHGVTEQAISRTDLNPEPKPTLTLPQTFDPTLISLAGDHERLPEARLRPLRWHISPHCDALGAPRRPPSPAPNPAHAPHYPRSAPARAHAARLVRALLPHVSPRSTASLTPWPHVPGDRLGAA